ncbi:MAG: hypothetical protein HYZ30_00820 [Candidatus Azosocius agrarius]|nr:MAG: hypothetical protein HYZ30_00820 [Gammaproteobacteria bacterium]
MNVDEFIFKKIVFLTRFLFNKNSSFNDSVLLENYLSRFILFSCAISENKINIISDEFFGGYIENTLLLPVKIHVIDDKDINLLIYIYKILFLSLSRKFKFFLCNNIFLANGYENAICSLLIVNSIHKKLIKIFPMGYKFINLLYPILIRKITDLKLNNAYLLLINIISKSLMFDKSLKKNNLNLKEKYFINYITKLYVSNCLELNLFFLHIIKCVKILYKINILNIINYNFLFNILWGQLLKEKILSLSSIINKYDNFSLSSGKEYKKNPKNEIEIIKYKKNSDKDNPVIRMLEHVKTAEQYKGGLRDMDGSDDIEQHFDSINELNLKQVMRTPGQTKSIFSMDILVNISQIDLNNDFLNKDFLYKEWDYSKNQYKVKWCKIYNIYASTLPIYLFDSDEKSYLKDYKEIDIINYYVKKSKKTIKYLLMRLKYIFNLSIWLNKQIYGVEIDIDSVTDRYAFLFSGNCNFDKLYSYKKVLNRELCLLILIDSSLSTDSWFKNEKISNIIRELVIILGEAVNKIFNNFFAINAFYSNTRNDCKYIIIKNFNDSWNHNKIFLCRIYPIGYTRIGPAIRHSLYYMNKYNMKYKLLLLISDTKPTDYDLYEGNYGINDVKKCVYEALTNNIKIKAISIDDKSKFYLSKMFGKNNYYLLKNKFHVGKLLSRIFFDCFIDK